MGWGSALAAGEARAWSAWGQIGESGKKWSVLGEAAEFQVEGAEEDRGQVGGRRVEKVDAGFRLAFGGAQWTQLAGSHFRSRETPSTASTCFTPLCPASCWSWPTSLPTSSPSKVSAASVWT